ncbi:efflux RND transporter periplasmic adaptor subunit [Azohydromonas sediminis]|uniref:efflux RND transporter periplasmic adaptor subunit n=1 Tax=Azohydromonas sediminis TaxID=2259674 RepID=UPI000E65B56B|nr:efflux RND transporter periplasmic adaptor subunit [Azohydromonas sediminis]
MNAWLRRGAVVAVVGAVAVGAALWIKTRIDARRAAATVTAAPAVVPALELGEPDVVRVARVELARSVDVAGGLRAVDTALVKARVAGEVVAVTVREGEPVRKGQVLVRIDPTEYDWRVRQAEQTADAARAQLDIARRTLDNNRALVTQGFISPTALDTSLANHAAAQANLNAALAAVEIARKARADATLVAPIDGVVSQRLVQPGERVPVDARLLEIVDPTRIELEAAIPPADAAALRVGAPARLRVDGLAEPVAARVARINPAAQAGSRAVLAYLALPAQPGLRPGLFARGSVELDRREVPAVPASALRIDQARPYVVVVEGPPDAARAVHRAVTPGAHGRVAAREGAAQGGDDWVELVDGPAEGTLLLAGTVGLVRDGTPLKLTRPAAAPVAATRQP